MDYIISEELIDWVDINGEPANDPKAVNNFTHDDIGDWAGEEELATEHLNGIMFKLESDLEGLISLATIGSLKDQVWNDWSKDTRILDINENDVASYVATLISRNMDIFMEDTAA